jgi:hypothetical protein
VAGVEVHVAREAGLRGPDYREGSEVRQGAELAVTNIQRILEVAGIQLRSGTDLVSAGRERVVYSKVERVRITSTRPSKRSAIPERAEF